MANNDSGLNEKAATAAINNIISGGADIHLLTQQGSYTDTSTEINNKSAVSVSVAEADFSVVSATDFTGTTKLELSSDVEFGSQNIGEVLDIAIVSGDNIIIGNEINTPDLSGEEYIIRSGEVLYELGNV
jgi:hypothetical protein